MTKWVCWKMERDWETGGERKREAEGCVKKLGYVHYLGFKIIEHNHENAHSLREMTNALGAESPPVNNTDNKLITSGYVLFSGQSTASGCLSFTPLLLCFIFYAGLDTQQTGFTWCLFLWKNKKINFLCQWQTVWMLWLPSCLQVNLLTCDKPWQD